MNALACGYFHDVYSSSSSNQLPVCVLESTQKPQPEDLLGPHVLQPCTTPYSHCNTLAVGCAVLICDIYVAIRSTLVFRPVRNSDEVRPVGATSG